MKSLKPPPQTRTAHVLNAAGESIADFAVTDIERVDKDGAPTLMGPPLECAFRLPGAERSEVARLIGVAENIAYYRRMES